ncbi:hypothetical protein ACQYRI_03680 [Salmonella enterica]
MKSASSLTRSHYTCRKTAFCMIFLLIRCVMVLLVWQKIPFCRIWWVDCGRISPSSTHICVFYLDNQCDSTNMGALWANGGLLNVIAGGCALAWNVMQAEGKLPKISLMDTGRAQTDRHSVSCIVMQRAENDSDAFFRFTLGKIHFCGFCVRIALSAF